MEEIRLAIADRLGPPPAGETHIGDDAAVVGWTDGRLVLAVDAVVAGVHADLGLVGLSDLGWKAMAAAVSDVGAMGALPRHALVTMCVPRGTDLAALTAGVVDAAREWGCAVVGGDLCSSGQLVVSVAVTGTLEGVSGAAVTRAGASAGDQLLVTGPLGASAAGLRLLRAGGPVPAPGSGPGAEAVEALVAAHRRPRARIGEGVAARAAGASAMIDVSDGLGLDLHRLATSSGVGVDVHDLPVAPGATESEALGGGEDYELLIATADPARLRDHFERAGLRRPVVIGVCTADPDQRDLRGRPMPASGWRHDLG